jgi:2-iminobutanoate/2-iminopropanoate deaminase
MMDHHAARKNVATGWLLVATGLAVWTAGFSPQPRASSAADGPYKTKRTFIYPAQFKAGRPYTPGVLAGETLYISGQIDKHPQTGAQPEGIANQTRMAMDNMGHVLHAAGMDYGNVVSCHVQLADIGQFAEMNKVYAGYFTPDRFPARTTLEFPGLPDGANIEVSCIAYADKSKIASVAPAAGTIPAAIGPYRPGVWAGDTLYVSGNGGRKPKTDDLDPTIEGQTKQTMDNIGQILSAAGLEQTDTVFTNVYFLDPKGYKGDTYGKLNSIYKDFFPLGLAPSRASFCVSRLPGTISVEMTYIATRDRAHSGRVIPAYNRQNQTSSRGGVLAGGTLYTSGRSAPGATVEDQMRNSMETIRDILKLAGMDMEHVVDAHVYLTDIAKMNDMNAIFKEYFPSNPPSRTTVQATMESLVQVQATAVR